MGYGQRIFKQSNQFAKASSANADTQQRSTIQLSLSLLFVQQSRRQTAFGGGYDAGCASTVGHLPESVNQAGNRNRSEIEI